MGKTKQSPPGWTTNTMAQKDAEYSQSVFAKYGRYTEKENNTVNVISPELLNFNFSDVHKDTRESSAPNTIEAAEEELKLVKETYKSTAINTRKLVDDSVVNGNNIILALNKQGDALDRINEDAIDIEDNFKRNQEVVSDMKRNWWVRLFCYKRDDAKPDPVEWNRDETEEEKVKKMLKFEQKIRGKKKTNKSNDEEDVEDENNNIPEYLQEDYLLTEAEKEKILLNKIITGERTQNVKKDSRENQFQMPVNEEEEDDGVLNDIEESVNQLKNIANAISINVKTHEDKINKLDRQIDVNESEQIKTETAMKGLKKARRKDKENNGLTNGLVSNEDKLKLTAFIKDI